jgi:hypothetical protein
VDSIAETVSVFISKEVQQVHFQYQYFMFHLLKHVSTKSEPAYFLCGYHIL